MSHTLINARIIDQTVQVSNPPLIASGSKGALKISCTFDSLWDGYGKTAVFYRDKTAVYHVPVESGLAAVPKEVLTEEGHFYLGFMGVAENTRTTEVVHLVVKQGAITTGVAPEEPTPDIYEQILTAYGVMGARLDEQVAMRGETGDDFGLSDEHIAGLIRSNGTHAFISFNISEMALVSGGSHYTDYCIPPALVPLAPIFVLDVSNPDINVTIEEADPDHDGWSRILIENTGTNDLAAEEIVMVRGFYPLRNTYIAELADLRAGADEKSYTTAGTAVRTQLKKLARARGTSRLSDVTLKASAWEGSDCLYSQVVMVEDVTEYSKVDLLPSVEQLAIFYNKDVTFVTENEDGVVTVYAIGDKPTQDYTMQVQITEVIA